MRAPSADGKTMVEWYVSNSGDAHLVITRGAAHRIVTPAQLNEWKLHEVGAALEDIEATLASRSAETVESTSDATGFTRRALSRASHAISILPQAIRRRYVDLAFAIAVLAAVVVAAHSTVGACAT